jgi:cellulose synthase/poly-beta-1,6-N-acetylglucosamine synthase-like glycosyltransferase
MKNGGKVLALNQPYSLEHCWNLIASVPFDKTYRPPLVSVVITAHNYARYLADAIQSVSAQTYTEFECIIVDDASSDNTQEVVKTSLGSMEDPPLFDDPSSGKSGAARGSGRGPG